MTLYSINPVHHLSLFQSTLPQGEWLPGNVIYSGGFNFNPHSRKGSDSGNFLNMSKIFYFNPHSRKGSDFGITVIAITKIISIHTPARGVTIKKGTIKMCKAFQSTLPQGEWRQTFGTSSDRKLDFNPHSRKGSDETLRHQTKTQKYFNPHSRKGSDTGSEQPCMDYGNFNPHSRKGSDVTGRAIYGL